MSASPDFDVVIVGAGLVGAALALGLARVGFRILLADKAAPPAEMSGDGRGLALAHSSVAVLEGLDIWSSLQPVAYPVKHIHVSQQGHFGALRLNHRALAVSALGFVCPASTLQRALSKALTGAAEITIAWATTLPGWQQTGSTLTLKLSSAEGTSETTTRLLVGADGTDSSVREWAGIPVRRRNYGQTAIVAAVEVARPRPHTAFERFTTSGPLALLPLGGSRHVLVRTAPTDEVTALLALPDVAYLKDTEHRLGGIVGTLTHLGPRRPHPLVLQVAQRLCDARCLLIGNAANTLHPNGAQGLNLGLRDVAALRDVLALVARTGGDPGNPEILQRYEERRLRDHQITRCITDSLAQTFAIGSPVIGGLRALALVGADRMPWLKRLALRRLALGEGHLG